MATLGEGTCREILEVSPDASLEEITQAYQRLKRFYLDDRMPFTAPSMDEFSEEARREILMELEAAYGELCRTLEASQPHGHPVPPPETRLPVDGPALRKVREAEGLTLDYIAAQTHVRREYLQALEEERYADLPQATVNVRGFLGAYVAELGLPMEAVVHGYMQRFLQWQGHRGR